ncbi:MAG: HupE/UreJ family protein [Neomegalonema sp.]
MERADGLCARYGAGRRDRPARNGPSACRRRHRSVGFCARLRHCSQRPRPQTFLGMAFVGFFALFHGHAHGAEIPRLAEPAAYVGGFMLATAALHIMGVLIGELCRMFPNPAATRALLGAGVAGVGAHMLLLSYGIV